MIISLVQKTQKKCRVLNSCYIKDYIYSKKKYLSTIESSTIRSTVTKLRLDMNCTWDCKNRSFQYKHVQSDKCPYCNEVQSLDHFLFHCKHPGLVKNRITFNEKYCKYVNNLDEKSDEVKLRDLLNINPPCAPEYKSKAMESICMFIRKAYHILHLNVNDKN